MTRTYHERLNTCLAYLVSALLDSHIDIELCGSQRHVTNDT